MTDFTAAEAGIRQLHARYTDSVWRQDHVAFGDCFSEDAEWRISGRIFRGRAEITDVIQQILSNANRILITFRTPILEVGDGVASGRCYVTEHCTWLNRGPNISIGRYYEHFVDEGDRWRFSWRLFQLHYSGPEDLSGTWYEHPDYGPPPGMPGRDEMPPDHASAKWGLAPVE